MNTPKISLEFIKRKAKKLRKERNISHTEALELLAKEYGFSNWQHCSRSLSKPAVQTKPVQDNLKISFTDWLRRHKNRNSPLGDLASDSLRDPDWPNYDNLEEYKQYLSYKGVSYIVTDALINAWRSYKAYLRRSKLPKPAKTKIKSKPETNSRRIVYVKNAVPLHYTKREVEKFSVGDSAWVSWDGRKAIPVTILGFHERHYTFKTERPLNKAGDEYFLFLDEVRSTPELACINRVTN